MADKKITGFNPAAAITANDIMPICQNLATGELLYSDMAGVRTFVLGGANAGARIYFTVGVPSNALGVDGDVVFDKQAQNIYQKVAGVYQLQDSYGASAAGSTGIIRFTAVYDSNGLSADGLTYHADELEDAIVLSVTVDATPLISVEDAGDVPAFDEFNHDSDTGDIAFGAPLPAGFRITITYSK